VNYIVLDLEWNQPASKESTSYQKYAHLITSEIIQIGAVKLDENKNIIDSFERMVQPCCYRKLHSHVKRLTSITQQAIDHADPFPVVAKAFREWCGEDCVFLTWGYDDMPALETNLSFHKLETSWIHRWYNLQVIFNHQEEQDGNQKALAAVIEYYQLEQDDQFHDALNDARYTGLIAARLDLDRGFEEYWGLVNPLITGIHGFDPPLEEVLLQNIPNKKIITRLPEISTFVCPDCGNTLAKNIRWVRQSGDKHLYLASCPEHGTFLLRLRITKGSGESFMVARTAERATEDIIREYHLREQREIERAELQKAKRAAKEQAAEQGEITE
jgi:inhibitor of KinA sporulation pathway (predicted exonuclease)/predicted RNA-binding Zn-ribbon protein involved in translation (DUF1610 family)